MAKFQLSLLPTLLVC